MLYRLATDCRGNVGLRHRANRAAGARRRRQLAMVAQ
jgi:hypothetical protein